MHLLHPSLFVQFLLAMYIASLPTKVSCFSKLSFRHHGSAMSRYSQRMSMSTGTHQLVLLRHGESTWNDENKFTGWYDCPLSAKGRLEAEAAGKLLKHHDFKFDLAYSSFLQRAIRTLWYSLEETGHMYIPIKTAWQLNERCVYILSPIYGGLFNAFWNVGTTELCRD